jgi:hypothetical protein
VDCIYNTNKEICENAGQWYDYLLKKARKPRKKRLPLKVHH